MKRYLIKYLDKEIISIIEAPKSGVTVSGTPYMIETLSFAKTMLQARGVDTTEIDEYEPVNDEFTQ